PFVLIDIEHGAQGRVTEPGCGLGFAVETGEGIGVGKEVRVRHLEGDGHFQHGVVGEEDRSHAAAAQALPQDIPAEWLREWSVGLESGRLGWMLGYVEQRFRRATCIAALCSV